MFDLPQRVNEMFNLPQRVNKMFDLPQTVNEGSDLPQRVNEGPGLSPVNEVCRIKMTSVPLFRLDSSNKRLAQLAQC